MPFIVTVPNAIGQRVPLRGTIFAFDMSRAQKFPTLEAAQAAIAKAKPFHKARVFKAMRIDEVAE